ncbi:MAG: AraC family transcriptional regulator [Clostridia bacterium]|nr:AraC family transcriptional regulator [Clostridia bacterium]
MHERFTVSQHISNGIVSASKKEINGCFNTHWHEFYEIEYIISGSGTYTIDDNEYEIKPGMIFFMTPVNFHSVQADNAKIYNAMFSGSICNSVYLSPLLQNHQAGVFIADENERRYIEAVFSQMTDKSNEGEFSLYIDCIAAKLCKLTSPFQENRSAVSQAAISYISQNFRNDISLTDAAESIGLSPTHLSETFKKQTGTGFKQYLNDLRFEYARKLLLFSEIPVSQVCSDSGFNDLANFIRRFTQRFGVSPSKYRKSHKENKE